MRDLLSSKIRLLRFHYPFFALSSFLMGGWMAVAPSAFWGLFGLEVGEAIIPTVYGAAIVGEGVICLLGFSQPLRYLPVLYYMVAYKLVVCAVLIPKLLMMSEPPLAGWLIVGAWGSVILICAFIVPWGRWPEIVSRMQQEVGEA